MTQVLSTYELALKFENAGDFTAAYPLFKDCLNNGNINTGNIYFHCGWCIENSMDAEKKIAVDYYLKAGNSECENIIRMNGFFRAGWLLMHMNTYAEAASCFKQAIEIGQSKCDDGAIYNQAIYWCAFCLESEKRYLDALNLYRTVTDLSLDLNPESRFREIICLVSIGLFAEALYVCKSFELPPPGSFSIERYEVLKSLAQKERALIEYGLESNNIMTLSSDA